MSHQPPARAFVTGALGFIGSAVAARLRAAGAEVRGVDLRDDPALGVVAGDVAEPGAWQDAVAGAELVVHTAAVVSNVGPTERYWRLNVLGTRRVLDAAARAGARRVVHLSSVRAFSDRSFPDGVDEHWPVRPDGRPYVDTKVASEQVVLQAHAAAEVAATVVRPGDVYGPGSRPWTIIPVEAIRAGRFLLPAMGRGVFSPVYVDTLVDGILAAASEPAAGHVLTLSDGIGVPTREFFGHYARMLGGRRIPVVPTSVARALAAAVAVSERLAGRVTEVHPAAVDYLARRGTYSIAKARSLIGYRPSIDLEEGMARTERWLADNGYLA